MQLQIHLTSRLMHTLMVNFNHLNRGRLLKQLTLLLEKLLPKLQHAMLKTWIMQLSKQGRRLTRDTGPNSIQVREKRCSLNYLN